MFVWVAGGRVGVRTARRVIVGARMCERLSTTLL
jgi:hypothetical protein